MNRVNSKQTTPGTDLHRSLLSAWETSNRVTEFFLANLPDEVWSMNVPGAPRRTVRMIAGHIHNARCMWIKMVGEQYRIKTPKKVDRRRVSQKQVLRALRGSSRGIIQLLKAGLSQGGILNIRIPWSNISSDVVHFMSYLVAHEAHHRGQIVLLAREMGHRLPQRITAGLWQWKKQSQRKAK